MEEVFVQIPEEDWRTIVRWHRRYAPDPPHLDRVSRDIQSGICEVPRDVLVASLWVPIDDQDGAREPVPDSVTTWRIKLAQSSTPLGSIGPISRLHRWLDYYAKTLQPDKATSVGLLILALEEGLKAGLYRETEVLALVQVFDKQQLAKEKMNGSTPVASHLG